MPLSKPITIMGGGLAGLTLGIALRQRGIPVTIWEAGCYPRHRVCGEFISGSGQAVLKRLGLEHKLFHAGAITANTAAFFFGTSHSPIRELKPPAWCLSRFVMDEALANHFRALGGELCEHSRQQPAHPGEGVVLANGRLREPIENGWRWFGLKVHARNLSLASDLEMHAFADGYVGLCRLQSGQVNVCGLFRKRVGDQVSIGNWQQLLRGPAGTVLHKRLDQAVFQKDSFCSVAGLSLKPQKAFRKPGLSIGDALTMIPPVTGNGMSMAFEAAEMALSPVTAYSRGEISWKEAFQIFSQTCDASFAKRLVWAKILHWLMFAPLFRESLGAVALRSQGFWRTMFAMTR